MQQPFQTSNQQDAEKGVEFHLIDVLLWIKNAWKVIAFFGLAGIALSITYLTLTPNQYEATAQITMAQISTGKNHIYPVGSNIEEPKFLISRLSFPTSSTPEVMQACGMQAQVDSHTVLSKSIKLTLLKGVTNMVEIKTFGHTPQAAKNCNLAVFEYIKSTQAQIVAPYIEKAQIKLAEVEDRLAKAKGMIGKLDKSGQLMITGYFSTRDEINHLLDEITSLKDTISFNQNSVTRMVAPIYVDERPIEPKKRRVLLVGLFGGLFLGFLIALTHQMFLKLKSVAGGIL